MVQVSGGGEIVRQISSPQIQSIKYTAVIQPTSRMKKNRTSERCHILKRVFFYETTFQYL